MGVTGLCYMVWFGYTTPLCGQDVPNTLGLDVPNINCGLGVPTPIHWYFVPMLYRYLYWYMETGIGLVLGRYDIFEIFVSLREESQL